MLDKFLFLLWFLAWTSGGLLLAASAFRLPRRLILGAGLALGAGETLPEDVIISLIHPR